MIFQCQVRLGFGFINLCSLGHMFFLCLCVSHAGIQDARDHARNEQANFECWGMVQWSGEPELYNYGSSYPDLTSKELDGIPFVSCMHCPYPSAHPSCPSVCHPAGKAIQVSSACWPFPGAMWKWSKYNPINGNIYQPYMSWSCIEECCHY